MPRPAWIRSPLAAVAILTMLIAQIGGAGASLCPTQDDRAAACRCCPKTEKQARDADARIAARCCAIEAGDPAGPASAPMARCSDPPGAIAPASPVIVAAAAPIARAPRAAVVIPRASGPPLWLTTRSLRL